MLRKLRSMSLVLSTLDLASYALVHASRGTGLKANVRGTYATSFSAKQRRSDRSSIITPTKAKCARLLQKLATKEKTAKQSNKTCALRTRVPHDAAASDVARLSGCFCLSMCGRITFFFPFSLPVALTHKLKFRVTRRVLKKERKISMHLRL